MKDPLKQQRKSSFEINWKMREFFSEAALASYSEEVDNKFRTKERNKE